MNEVHALHSSLTYSLVQLEGFTSFTVYSIFAVSVYSLASFLITDVLPIDVEVASPLAQTDLLLCSIFGGALSGIGSGFVIRYGGAIDGIDVLSVLFARKLNISIGNFVMIFNVVLYIICGCVLQSWILPLYSMVTYFVASKTVDFIVDGFDQNKCAMIITGKADQILESINKTFTTSGTLLDAVGGYSRKKKNVIYFVVSRFQINKLNELVAEVDPKAMIMLLDVSDMVKQGNAVEPETEPMDVVAVPLTEEKMKPQKEVKPIEVKESNEK